MEDFELFPDEEEEAVAEEGSNRTFIILVAVFGGILAIGICAFIVWAAVLLPMMRERETQNALVKQTAEVLTAVAEAAPDETQEPEVEPTETPLPPTEEPTKVPPTATPKEVAVVATEEEEPAATVEATATRRPTVTPKPTATGSGEADEVPTTGIGAFGAVGVGIVLMVILVAARRLRRIA
jgi:flagellar biosynthesis/type III secretory pathway M-ring protein FliF/YscJ